MSEKKPTAAAMRAAEKIALNFETPNTGEWAYFVRDIAPIIDAETGLPELIEACQAIAECWADSDGWVRVSPHDVEKLRALLVKASRVAIVEL